MRLFFDRNHSWLLYNASVKFFRFCFLFITEYEVRSYKIFKEAYHYSFYFHLRKLQLWKIGNGDIFSVLLNTFFLYDNSNFMT